MIRADILSVARRFTQINDPASIESLGSGNINDTYLVKTNGGSLVIQRMNANVFKDPCQVIGNMMAVSEHIKRRISRNDLEFLQPANRRWETPQLIPTKDGCLNYHIETDGSYWRCMTFIEDCFTVDVLESVKQASEMGSALGLFHRLVSDLDLTDFRDTLEGFHITPGYLKAYHRALVHTNQRPSAGTELCIQFIREREAFADVLEQAKARGEIPLRPIHGDPKINNVMLDRQSGEAVALIDLDTVKPGLVHYDLGDCLRSGCNPMGEETADLDAVVFDLGLAEAILDGYFSVAGPMLTAAEVRLIPDAARLISFELGLRFFSDYLNGSTYFKANHPEHNLERALVQFQLTASIETQMESLRAMVERLAAACKADAPATDAVSAARQQRP